MRICITCKENKEDSCFHKDKSKPDGIYTICKQCLKNKYHTDELKIKKREYDKQYRIKNKEIYAERHKIYQKNLSLEQRAKYNREYRHRHADKWKKWDLDYRNKNKCKFAWRAVLRNFFIRFGIKKNGLTCNLLDYDFEKFKQRIEFNFKEGMSWNNYGEWHIDHKKPISKFKIDTPPHIVNALCNLQPLWAKDNLSKGNKF